ncbi:37S ribosomal protein MRP21, mitochondrial [Wickerhamomyces ciferrii]|uniref:37S ribosomal protein MRP21, mitochondrial n=1 Tax=Wickerhamomyces ciferrii (strain ATCC 14091 / BCRC 22168 / CBS 111 / JCM 3599 / NBRC 0793 / NRRL Y-1031 F-60-10) TaxID=1206466 RepID=K0KYH3_WICCF|nr:37S ribosomal protein MRP21, mitochondrial [Wickerhamomyces ciferrii]CCH47127.1 37S ribosomal protein MRP21, mitochondrial [Wickerhamomyces ciferrii]
MFRLGCRSIQSTSVLSSIRFNSTAAPTNPKSKYLLDALKKVSKSQNSIQDESRKTFDVLSLRTDSKENPLNRDQKLSKERFEFLSRTDLKAKPKDVAKQLRITNPTAGKIYNVVNNDINGAFRALQSNLNANKVKQDKINQRFHIKPGKAREAKTIRRNKVVFMNGFRRLMNVVRDAKRRGY